MVRLIGIPREVGETIRTWLSGSIWEILWKAAVTVVLLFVAYALAAAGSVVLGAIAFLLISFIFAEEVIAVVSDTYERRWARVDLSRLWPFAVVLLAAVTVVALPAPVMGSSTVELPQSPLERQAEQFSDGQPVTANYQRIDATVTVSETAEGAGLSGLEYTDVDTTYLRLDYDEEISRTIQVTLPESYATPRPKDDLEAAESGVTADLRRTADGAATTIEVKVDGKTDVVFPLSKAAGVVFSVRDGVRSRVSNETGIQIPSISSQGDWTIVDDELQPESTYQIQHPRGPLTIQYEANDRWVPAAPCDTEDTAICLLERASNATVTTVLADGDEPPRMRYQSNAGIPAQVQGTVNEIMQIPSRLDNALAEIAEGVPFL